MFFFSVRFLWTTKALLKASTINTVLLTTPHSSVWHANLLSVHSIPSYKSLTKMLSITGHGIEHLHTPLVTYLQVDFVTLITKPLCPLSHFLIHLTVHLSIPYFVNSPTKVKVKNTDCFSIIHQANHHTHTVEWNQVGQPWFSPL